MPRSIGQRVVAVVAFRIRVDTLITTAPPPTPSLSPCGFSRSGRGSDPSVRVGDSIFVNDVSSLPDMLVHCHRTSSAARRTYVVQINNLSSSLEARIENARA